MKQIQFETSKVYGVFVKDITPEFTDLHPQYSHYLNQGSVSNLTDEQKEGVVEKYSAPLSLYKNYIIDSGYMEHLCTTASESFASLLTSLNVLLVNPIPEPEMQGGYNENGFGVFGYDDKWVEEYQKFQQNVGNWILLTCNK